MIPWFAVFAGSVAVAFAALMLTRRSLYSAAVCFLAVILQLSVLFYAVGARLLAFLLLLIYAGAVAVLIVVSINAAQEGSGERRRWNQPALSRGLIAAGFLPPLLEAVVLLARGGATSTPAAPIGDLALGPALFGPYAAAAEAVALLMLFAALAVVDKPEASR